MYRFSDIWGNERLVAHLRRALQEDRISHACLFTGGKGMGKKMLARTFAMALECEGEGEKPCGHCASCSAFLSGTHPDILTVRPTKKTLGVDDVREQILEDIKLKQYRYRYKIYLVEQADTMTVQAQNALLKILEEPPSYGIFLLMAERMEAFLPTVLSRTVVLQMQPVPAHEIEKYLQTKKMLSDSEAAVCSTYAQGSIGQALSLLEDADFHKMREDILDKLERLQRTPLAEVLLWAKDLEMYKNDLRFLDIMLLWYRDILAAKCLHDPSAIIQKDKQEEIFEGVGKEAAEIAKQADAVVQARCRLAQNANFRLTMEVMLMQLKGEKT